MGLYNPLEVLDSLQELPKSMHTRPIDDSAHSCPIGSLCSSRGAIGLELPGECFCCDVSLEKKVGMLQEREPKGLFEASVVAFPGVLEETSAIVT